MAPRADAAFPFSTAVRDGAGAPTDPTAVRQGYPAAALHIYPNIYPTSRQTCDAAAEFVAERLRSAVAERGAGSLAISGGKTAAPFFRALAGRADRVPWAKTTIFLVDERFVPPDHADSNLGLARRDLLDRLPELPAAVMAFATTGVTPTDAAATYSSQLRERLGDGGIDVVVLGIGADGHTASLFPPADALLAEGRGAVALFVPHLGSWRLTLSLAELNAATDVCFVAVGEAKAQAVALALANPSPVPAGRVRPHGRPPHWYLDAAAAAKLQPVDAFQ